MHLLSREKVTETAVVNEVANPSPVPALIALNICNALNWKEIIGCVNFDSTNLHVYKYIYIYIYIQRELIFLYLMKYLYTVKKKKNVGQTYV